MVRVSWNNSVQNGIMNMPRFPRHEFQFKNKLKAKIEPKQYIFQWKSVLIYKDIQIYELTKII